MDFAAILPIVRDAYSRFGGDTEPARAEIERKFEGEAKAFAFTALSTLARVATHESAKSAARSAEVWIKVIDEDGVGNYRPVRSLGTSHKREWEYYEVMTAVNSKRRFMKRTRVGASRVGDYGRAQTLAEYGMAAFVHPNVVRVFDAGKVRVGDKVEQFVATEFIDGKTLEAWRQHRPINEREAAKILAVIVDALVALRKHELADKSQVTKETTEESKVNQFLHLDLKPSNVMVQKLPSEEADETTIKLIDFASSGTPDDALAERTWNYAAPERFAKSDRPLPNATWDIFSAGGILYFLLFGKDPVPPNCRAGISDYAEEMWNSWVEGICVEDWRLGAILRKCMAFHAKDRYQTPDELQADLFLWIHDYPLVHAHGDEGAVRNELLLLRRIWSRNDGEDHTQVMARLGICLLGAIAVVISLYISLSWNGVAPAVAFAASGYTSCGFVIPLMIFGIAAARGQFVSTMMFAPLMMYSIATAIVCMNFAPIEREFITSCQFNLLMYGLLNFSLGCTVEMWRPLIAWGLVCFVGAIPFRAIVEWLDAEWLSPVAMWSVFMIGLVFFAATMLKSHHAVAKSALLRAFGKQA